MRKPNNMFAIVFHAHYVKATQFDDYVHNHSDVQICGDKYQCVKNTEMLTIWPLFPLSVYKI